MIALIVARARGGAIGRDGDIPWRAPEDLAFFQRETLGGALVMGRRTWESLPKRPLPRRMNIVVTRGDAPGADAVVPSVDEAVAAARGAGYFRIYGAGGAAIYAALMPSATRMLITEVDAEVPDADTFFPDFDEGSWRVSARAILRETAPRCMVREWVPAPKT